MPSLVSYFALTTPDPLDRYRVSGGVMFERSGKRWRWIGWCGFRIQLRDTDVYHSDDDLFHSPWLDGRFWELASPVEEFIAASLSAEQRLDYSKAIRVNQIDRPDLVAPRDIGPPPSRTQPTIDDLITTNPSPELASWANVPTLFEERKGSAGFSTTT